MSNLTIRTATASDASAIRRLASLDDRPPPRGRVLLAEIGGQLRAALSLAGEAIGDPFEPTAQLIEILELRASQLRVEEARPHRGRTRALPLAAGRLHYSR